MIGVGRCAVAERRERPRVGDAGPRQALPLLERDHRGLRRGAVDAVDAGRIEVAERGELLLQRQRGRRGRSVRGRHWRRGRGVRRRERRTRQRHGRVDTGEQAERRAALDQQTHRADAGHRSHGADDLVEAREGGVGRGALQEPLAEIDRRDVARDRDAAHHAAGRYVRPERLRGLGGCRPCEQRLERVVHVRTGAVDRDELLALSEEHLHRRRGGRASRGRGAGEQHDYEGDQSPHRSAQGRGIAPHRVGTASSSARVYGCCGES